MSNPECGCDFVDDVAIEQASDGWKVKLNHCEATTAVLNLYLKGWKGEDIVRDVGIPERVVARARIEHVAAGRLQFDGRNRVKEQAFA